MPFARVYCIIMVSFVVSVMVFVLGMFSDSCDLDLVTDKRKKWVCFGVNSVLRSNLEKGEAIA